MPHLSKTPYNFGFTSDALTATLEFERNTTEFYAYETRYVGDFVQVRVRNQDDILVGFVAGEE